MDTEIWKDIPGYEGLYQVSDMGNVRSLNYKRSKTIKELLPSYDSAGYKFVYLYKSGKSKFFRVHRLVLIGFIGISDLVVNHIDGNKSNNALINLEYTTQSKNVIHAYRVLGKNNIYQTNHPCIGKFGKDNNLSKRVMQISMEGSIIKEWDSLMDIQRELHIACGNITRVCRGQRNMAGGFIWKYL